MGDQTMCLTKCINKGPTKEILYTVARIIIGFIFMSHGAQMLFGILGKEAIPLASSMGVFKLFEFLIGIALILGLLTRLAAIGGAIQMILAYGMAHMSKSLHPLTNGGEAAVLYFAAFLIFIAFGSGKYSLEQAAFKKEIL